MVLVEEHANRFGFAGAGDPEYRASAERLPIGAGAAELNSETMIPGQSKAALPYRRTLEEELLEEELFEEELPESLLAEAGVVVLVC